MAADSATHPTLLERLRDAEDATAWQDFHDRYWRAVYGFAKRFGCADGTAEDVVQDVMLAVFEGRRAFRYDPSQGRFRSWLYAVVRQKVAFRFRRRQHEAAAGQAPDELALSADEADLDEAEWERTFQENLLLALLDAVRREVSPETYQAFELTELHEVPAKEAAELTGLTRNAVYLARKRVLDRLQELGAPYRQEGRLDERLRRALALRPPPSVQRDVTSRLETAMAGAGRPSQ